MVKATLYQHRGQITPVEIRLELGGDHVRIDMKQNVGVVEISTDDPEWLEELESAIRSARLHLEARGNLRVVS